MVAQTLKPQMWVIVSDSSTDGTDDVVRSYAKDHPFISLCRTDEPASRDTAAKVRALSKGIEVLRPFDYAYIGNLDADVSFDESYFETLIERFERDRRLGVIGGRIFQIDARGRARQARGTAESIAGAVQFFRRECFDEIGGYKPFAGGMEDGIAEISARYYGWRTRSYTDLPVVHHRELGTVGRSVFSARFKNGATEYIVGFGFVYHVLRALTRVGERPYVIGTVLIIAGYAWARLSRQPKVISDEIARFMHNEQMAETGLASTEAGHHAT